MHMTFDLSASAKNNSHEAALFLFASLHLYDYVYESVDKILLFDSIHCYS